MPLLKKKKNKPAIAKGINNGTNDDFLRHMAFSKSLLANIVTIVSSGEIIMANPAACKLLGYSKTAILNKTDADIFKVHEPGFKKMLRQRFAKGYSSALVTAIRKDSKTVDCEITSSMFRGERGIQKAITTVADRSHNILKQKHIDDKKEKMVAGDIVRAQKKSDDRFADNNEWIKYIAKASYDVMWDWDLVSGSIYVGDSVEEVFGYKVEDNTVRFGHFIHCLTNGERQTVKKKLLKTLSSAGKSWNDTFMIKRFNGSTASTLCRASIVRNEQGRAMRMIGAIQDVSRLQELEKRLADQIILHKADARKKKTVATAIAQNISKQKRLDTQKEKVVAGNILLAQLKSDTRLAENNEKQAEKFNLAAKLSFDGIWDWNLTTNEFFLGESFEELFGYTIKDTTGALADWSNHLHPEDKRLVEKGMQAAIASAATKWEQAYRFIRLDGSIAQVFGRASIVRNGAGKAVRMIGVVHDLSRQKELEDKLELEIRLKEKQIAEARQDAKDAERSDIGKELHDNVNQLLGASRLYLDMAKRGGTEINMFLNRCSEYTLSAIEEIRKLSRGLTTDIIKNYGLCEAIDNIVHDTMEVSKVKIQFTYAGFKEKSVNDRFKLNIFRIVQEQLNNILKHAHATKVAINLSQQKAFTRLMVSDNGVGFDTGKREKGIGLANIKSRAASHSGTAAFVSKPGQGCVLTVAIPTPLM